MQLKTVNSCTIWLGPQSKLQTQMVCPFLCLLHGNIYGLIEIRPALSLSLSTSLSLSRKKKVSFSLTIFSDSATIFQVLAVHHWFTAPSVPQISQPYQIQFMTVFVFFLVFFMFTVPFGFWLIFLFFLCFWELPFFCFPALLVGFLLLPWKLFPLS